MLRDWSRALPQPSGKQRVEDFLPQALRDALPAIETTLTGSADIVNSHQGAEHMLVRLADGQTLESVLLPRGGLCISSQASDKPGQVHISTKLDLILI